MTLPAVRSLSAASAHPSISTGKERDTESGNDYFGARYYSSTMGRWLSPDWSAKAEPVPYAKLDDPQSLNLYSYVRNNPLSRTDPDGHADPTRKEVIKELNRLADGYKVPRAIVLGVAKTESNFNIHEKHDNRNAKGKIESTDYGVMQINSRNIGKGKYTTGSDGKPLAITKNVEDPANWKANANVGVAIVADNYRTAVKEQPQGSEEDRGQQTYSGYNGGSGERDRYLKTSPHGENGGYSDIRDYNYVNNYNEEKNNGDTK